MAGALREDRRRAQLVGSNGSKSSDSGKRRSSARDDPLLGTVLADKFRIQQMLGRGGMGNVYRAVQQPLGRAVAVKVLSPTYPTDDDPGFVERFLREASAAAKLQHPNCITIYDFGSDGDLLYIAMELLEGHTLRAVIKRDGPLRVGRALHVAKQICKALREAHQHGLVHRDVKPSNVILTERDEDPDFVKVLDFGLVKFIDSESDLTRSGTFLGSPKYMSPEQIRKGRCDARSDVYSLGVVIYQMLSGRPPFQGESVSVLMAHLNDRPLPLHILVPDLDIPRNVGELVLRCLEKDPADRFQNIDEMLDALRKAEEDLFGDRSISSRPLELHPSQILSAEVMPETAPGKPMARRRSWLMPSLAVGALLLVGAGITGWVALGGEDAAEVRDARDEAAGRRAAARDGKDRRDDGDRGADSSGEGTSGEDTRGEDTRGEDDEGDRDLPAVELEVTSTPSGVEVRIDGEYLGLTPLRIDWKPASDPVDSPPEIELRATGHVTKRITGRFADGAIRVSASLKSLAPVTARPAGKKGPGAKKGKGKGSVKGARPATTAPGVDGYKADPY